MLNIYSASLIDNKKTIEKCLKNLKKSTEIILTILLFVLKMPALCLKA